jgi:hypothetical protein
MHLQIDAGKLSLKRSGTRQPSGVRSLMTGTGFSA